MRKNWTFTVSAIALTWASTAAGADITTAITTPVTTATANNGAPDNVVITAAGSIKPTSGAAVTLNSSNTVTNNGIIEMRDINGATGVLVQGGFTGAVTNTGSITLDEAANPTDSDSDGDADGPFATGTGRYGVRVVGATPFTGAITNSGVITVEGNDSAGISVETNLTGSVANNSSLTITGSRTYGLRTTGSVSGDVSSRGAISMVGEGAQAISVEGAVGGGVVVQGALVTTGYRFTTRNSDPALVAKLDADDLLQAGSAISISNNVTRGLLLDAPPVDKDSANTDEDADGIADASEGTASVVTYGSAPAIKIGATDKDIRLGVVGTGDNGYGVVIRGSVRGQGVYDGVTATGLRFGLVNGGKVVVDGGLRNAGSIAGVANVADAMAVVAESGAELPVVRNDGQIAASVTSEGVHTATGLAIRAGAKVPSLVNNGALTASVFGEKGDAVALRDQSGTLTEIRNGAVIAAVLNPTDDANDTDDTDTFSGNETITGNAIAIDVSANTTGVRVIQTKETSAAPTIVGAIRFGSGADRIDALAGSIDGDISFGAGANILAINGGATVAGRITATGGTLDLSVVDGALTFRNADALAVTGLTLGAKSQLIFTVDPTTGAATRLNVSGAASIASGAKLGLRLASLQNGTQTYTVIQAGQLTAGSIDSTLVGSIPYLYSSNVTANTSTGTVQIAVSRKTASALQLAPGIAGAYEPFLTAAAKDDDLETAVLSVTDRSNFLALYEHTLPNRTGGVFQWVTAASDAFARASTERSLTRGGLFVQETAFGVVRDSEGEQAGYKAWGVGLTGGYETGETGLGVFGLTVSGASGEMTDDSALLSEKMVLTQIEGGGYWRVRAGGFTANVGATGGYLDVESDRAIALEISDSERIQRSVSADWKGWTVNARAAADYKLSMGKNLFLRPSASVAYHRLRENDYREHGGGEAVDVIVDARTSSQVSAFAGLGIGATFGEEGLSWGPELTLGWRQIVKDSGGKTTGRFASGGDAFTLTSGDVGDQGPVARLSFKGDLPSGGFALQLGAERRDNIDNYDFRLAAHLVF